MFHDEDKAREYFERQPDGKPFCVHCGSTNVHRLKGQSHRAGLFQCNDCLCAFTVITKSVMENSHVPLGAQPSKGASPHRRQLLTQIWESLAKPTHGCRPPINLAESPTSLRGLGGVLRARRTASSRRSIVSASLC
jgi:hypothetical protein